jgi:hypothetical protein
MYLKLFKKQEQADHKTSRSTEVIKIRSEINEMETKRIIQCINETKIRLFEKINNIDNPLAKQPEKEERRPKLIKSVIKKWLLQ